MNDTYICRCLFIMFKKGIKAMVKTYAKCNNCCREYRCMVARDLIYCAYCGKELTAKTSINFEWITQGAHPGIGGLDFKVAHYDKDIKSVRVIGRKTGEFM